MHTDTCEQSICKQIKIFFDGVKRDHWTSQGVRMLAQIPHTNPFLSPLPSLSPSPSPSSSNYKIYCNLRAKAVWNPDFDANDVHWKNNTYGEKMLTPDLPLFIDSYI